MPKQKYTDEQLLEALKVVVERLFEEERDVSYAMLCELLKDLENKFNKNES